MARKYREQRLLKRQAYRSSEVIRMSRKFRLLNADEIECRVSTVNANGVSLLLYKDARADMTILDETVGAMNWQRRHTRDNANCIVSIYDENKDMWIEKEDTGTESNTEKEKGLASDSFKRACTNWGIGRELYTSPFIWVNADKIKWTERNGKKIPLSRFKVSAIGYDDKCRISRLEIKDGEGYTVYEYGGKADKPKADKPKKTTKKMEQSTSDDVKSGVPKINQTTVDIIESIIVKTNIDKTELLKYYRVDDVRDMTQEQARHCLGILQQRLKDNGQI